VPRAHAPVSIPVRILAPLVVVTAGLFAASCSSDDPSATKVAVTGTNTGCEVAESSLPAGPIDFQFTNKADDVSELYVLKENGDVVGEVENVTTGTERTLSADLAAGEYKVRCKPGQTGKGITSSFTVTGSGGKKEAAADRTISFDAKDFAYQDLDLKGIAAGDTVRFEMKNTGTQPHEFEVLGPDGESVGEVASVEAGKTGGSTMTLAEAGTYTYQCILVDEASGTKHDMMGMKGTFTVS
jgi:plastocyanin